MIPSPCESASLDITTFSGANTYYYMTVLGSSLKTGEGDHCLSHLDTKAESDALFIYTHTHTHCANAGLIFSFLSTCSTSPHYPYASNSKVPVLFWGRRVKHEGGGREKGVKEH